MTNTMLTRRTKLSGGSMGVLTNEITLKFG